MSRIQRALLSVSDKTGIVELARGLADLGVELISTGGTARALVGAGLAVREVSGLTGFPEMLDGRVKTLHPAIHGAILARRDRPEHLAQLAEQKIAPIDLVAVNLYPFEETARRPGVGFEEVIEQIDIGGPTLIRAAAKNHAAVAILVDPAQYGPVLEELRASGGSLSAETRLRLAREAFRRTAQYDAAIAAWLREPAATRAPAAEAPPVFPPLLRVEAERREPLRYGENPHQAAAFYRPLGAPGGLGAARQLHGPELSYNNLLDLSAALGLLQEFAEPACVVIKHTNPCGAALGADVVEAFGKARASDPVSIYGGIVGVNRPVEPALAEALAGILLEILFAPTFTEAALEELRRTKKKLRVLELPLDRPVPTALDLRSVAGGLLVQGPDLADLDPSSLKVVTRRQPTEAEWSALRFAWKVAKHVKSNAIVLATADQVVGVGAGQMNRLDSARLA
ncbi:MAG: bifunctional phosphoribosylaminoimidazolecarboxamide formyltransferase/IMP cyclohydrolase, partial [Candidatus Rokubacteria bacterium]|nr:bifunctional phosphoribosylaminoimidazolecarboxamide formyltransferase/IMP cyclohydrolase [Candidatus Rokubacteria bacterium]